MPPKQQVELSTYSNIFEPAVLKRPIDRSVLFSAFYDVMTRVGGQPGQEGVIALETSNNGLVRVPEFQGWQAQYYSDLAASGENSSQRVVLLGKYSSVAGPYFNLLQQYTWTDFEYERNVTRFPNSLVFPYFELRFNRHSANNWSYLLEQNIYHTVRNHYTFRETSNLNAMAMAAKNPVTTLDVFYKNTAGPLLESRLLAYEIGTLKKSGKSFVAEPNQSGSIPLDFTLYQVPQDFDPTGGFHFDLP
jgi:hypothetical protein